MKGRPYIEIDPVGTGFIPVHRLGGRVAALKAGHPQGASLHNKSPQV